MDDLISRAALLKECAECQKTDPHFEERGWANHFINSAGEPSTEWYCVEDMIENAPAVDAVPVVHGRWISYPECLAFEGAYHDEHIVCSACHSVWNIIDNDTERFDYCPNCGAKMDGERRENDAQSND